MIHQHDHAQLSGDIASNIKKEFFKENSLIDSVIIAGYEHDRCWIALDDTPIWNDHIKAPFSFIDYPLRPKLVLYSTGLDEIEKMNNYACLLSSLHFTSFFIDFKQQPACMSFVERELNRQQLIRDQYKTEDFIIDLHLKFLQFCDDLSLYVCLNEPGISKSEEHLWYRNGIGSDKLFNNQKINAYWNTKNQIKLSDFIFENEFITRLKYKCVYKSEINKFGINEAYKLAKLIEDEIHFCR